MEFLIALMNCIRSSVFFRIKYFFHWNIRFSIKMYVISPKRKFHDDSIFKRNATVTYYYYIKKSVEYKLTFRKVEIRLFPLLDFLK